MLANIARRSLAQLAMLANIAMRSLAQLQTRLLRFVTVNYLGGAVTDASNIACAGVDPVADRSCKRSILTVATPVSR